MTKSGIQPLDLQTEQLDRSQYPSPRFLLVIAAAISSLLMLSWAAHRNDAAPQDEEIAAIAAPGDLTAGRPTHQATQRTTQRIDRQLVARAIPLRP